jgi:hypothetical protein
MQNHSCAIFKKTSPAPIGAELSNKNSGAQRLCSACWALLLRAGFDGKWILEAGLERSRETPAFAQACSAGFQQSRPV